MIALVYISEYLGVNSFVVKLGQFAINKESQAKKQVAFQKVV